MKSEAENESSGIIANPRTDAVALSRAIALLPKAVRENPAYWNHIASSSAYGTLHRRRAAAQLFRRHIHVGTRLIDMGHILNRPKWFRASDISEVTRLTGWLPLAPNYRDTLFVICLFRNNAPGTIWTEPSWVYLNVPHIVSLGTFRNVVLGHPEKSSDISRTKLAEVRVSEIAVAEGDYPYGGVDP